MQLKRANAGGVKIETLIERGIIFWAARIPCAARLQLRMASWDFRNSSACSSSAPCPQRNR